MHGRRRGLVVLALALALALLDHLQPLAECLARALAFGFACFLVAALGWDLALARFGRAVAAVMFALRFGATLALTLGTGPGSDSDTVAAAGLLFEDLAEKAGKASASLMKLWPAVTDVAATMGSMSSSSKLSAMTVHTPDTLTLRPDNFVCNLSQEHTSFEKGCILAEVAGYRRYRNIISSASREYITIFAASNIYYTWTTCSR